MILMKYNWLLDINSNKIKDYEHLLYKCQGEETKNTPKEHLFDENGVYKVPMKRLIHLT